MYAKCPKCGSDKTHSSRVRPGERTTSTLFLKPMRCRQCKERFWVQNRGAYVAAGAFVCGGLLFLGLVWLVAMHATRSQDIFFSAPSASTIPATAVPQPDAGLEAGNTPARDTETGSSDGAPAAREAAPAQRGLNAAEGDLSITVQWYRENAEKGDLDAQYKLGLLHLTGKGALQDFAEAAKWLKLSADQGHPQAQFQLGLIYRVGHGVPTDQTQAYKWLNLAAAGGVTQAVLVRNEVLRSLSADQLAQAQKASREWQASRPKLTQAKPAAKAAEGDSNQPAAAPAQSEAQQAPPEPSADGTPDGDAPQMKAKAGLPESSKN